MKKIQIIFNITFITIILFFLLNFALGIAWEIRTKIKFKDFKPYDDIVLNSLKLSEEDGLKLYLETFINRKFDYEQFTEHAENNGYNNKFVNVTPELGRKTISPKNCDQKIFLYGGSTAFGYNVTDDQTIASQIGRFLIESNYKICIKNFGRGSYFSTQENILFQKHILEEKIKYGDIIIFLDGINENGNRNSRNTGYLYEANKIINQKYWDMYKYTFPFFFESLSFNQFIKKIQKKFNLKKKDNYDQQNIFDLDRNLKTVFQQNILIREGVCLKLKLHCYSFLQPFATIHGVYFDKMPKGAIENRPLQIKENVALKRKYEILKNIDGIIDISNSLDTAKELSYVDGVHYSPSASLIIANKISDIIKDKFNGK